MISGQNGSTMEIAQSVSIDDLELTASELQTLVREVGIDQTTQILFEAIKRSESHGTAIRSIDSLCSDSTTLEPRTEPKVIVVPGFLHREYPDSGADGRLLIEAAKQLRWEFEVVPTASTGRLVDNASLLLRFLAEHDERPLVLASISKGGSEVAAALQLDPSGAHFANVIGWVDVCGILRGSPVVDHVARQRIRMLGFRAVFALRRWTFESVMDLRYNGGTLANGFDAPDHMRIVHAIGFPQQEDFTLAKLRGFHQQIGRLGPNDGAILLHDALRSPGVVYPVQGADHYMRPRFRVQPLCRGMLRYAAGCEVCEEVA